MSRNRLGRIPVVELPVRDSSGRVEVYSRPLQPKWARLWKVGVSDGPTLG